MERKLKVTLWQASAFIMFPDIYSSCRGASILRDHTAVDAVEMFDRASLRFRRRRVIWELLAS